MFKNLMAALVCLSFLTGALPAFAQDAAPPLVYEHDASDLAPSYLTEKGARAACLLQFAALGIGLIVWEARRNIDHYWKCGPAMSYCTEYHKRFNPFKWEKGKLCKAQPNCCKK